MISPVAAVVLVVVAGSAAICRAETVVEEAFRARPGDGWRWVRENPDGWRLTPGGLEVLIEPGNLWGPANDAKNVLVRDAPDPAGAEVSISVTVSHRPESQYEQADLAWYYDDSHMVKLGLELVDGTLSIVMGREEGDRTRTVRILPAGANTVSLRLTVRDNTLRGAFRPAGSDDWTDVGECDLPKPSDAAKAARPQIALQFYQGDAAAPRWAKVTDFRVTRRVEAK